MEKVESIQEFNDRIFIFDFPHLFSVVRSISLLPLDTESLKMGESKVHFIKFEVLRWKMEFGVYNC